jgi:hypothetical protein
MHQPDEFIEISEIEKCVQFMKKLFAVMCEPERWNELSELVRERSDERHRRLVM